MVVNILFYILIFLLSFSLELFVAVFGGFSLVVIFLLFFFKKLDWKKILIFGLILSVCLDVVNHYVLGTNLLLLGSSVLFFYLSTLVFPEQKNLLGLFPYIFSFLVYYLMKQVVPHFMLFGSFGGVQGPDVWKIFLMSVISSGLVFLLDVLYDLFRSNKVSSNVVLK
jgi:hypothetical protein